MTATFLIAGASPTPKTPRGRPHGSLMVRFCIVARYPDDHTAPAGDEVTAVTAAFLIAARFSDARKAPRVTR